MSRSFRGRPNPEPENEDDFPVDEHNIRAAQPEDSSSSPSRINLNSLHKYGAHEQLAVQPVQVDVGKRLVAGIIDVLAASTFGFVVNCIPLPLINLAQLPLVAFMLIRDSLFHGRGLGKNLMGLQVVDIKTGKAASFQQSILRNVVLFGPLIVLYTVNLMLKLTPHEFQNSIGNYIDEVITTLGTIYTLVVIPYEAWRAFTRDDGLRWGDQFAGTAIVPADMDFSNPLPK